MCYNRWPDSENHFSWELGTHHYELPDIYAKLLQPTGFKLSIPDNPRIDEVTFHVNIDKNFTPYYDGDTEFIPDTTINMMSDHFYSKKRARWVYYRGEIDGNMKPLEMSEGMGVVDPGQYVHLATDVDLDGMWSYINPWVRLKPNTTVHFYLVAKCADNMTRSRLDQYFVVGQRENGTLYIRERNKFISMYGFQG